MINLVIDSENEKGYDPLIKSCQYALRKIDDLNIILVGKKELIGILPQGIEYREIQDHENSTTEAARLAKERQNPFLSFGDTSKACYSFIPRNRISKYMPSIICTIPSVTEKDAYNLMTDVGIIMDIDKPEQWVNMTLYSIAIANIRLGIENPSIGFIGTGEENSSKKVPKLLWEQREQVYSILKKIKNINLIEGFYEGDTIFNQVGAIELVPGYPGNVLLKTAEKVAKETMKKAGLEASVSEFNPELLGAMPIGPTKIPFAIGHRNSSMEKIIAGILAAHSYAKQHDAINQRYEENCKSIAA